MYLTLFISDLPILPGEQVIVSRIEHQITDRIVEYPVSEIRSYISSMIEVLEEDVNSRVADAPADQLPPEADQAPAAPSDNDAASGSVLNKTSGEAVE